MKQLLVALVVLLISLQITAKTDTTVHGLKWIMELTPQGDHYMFVTKVTNENPIGRNLLLTPPSGNPKQQYELAAGCTSELLSIGVYDIDTSYMYKGYLVILSGEQSWSFHLVPTGYTMHIHMQYMDKGYRTKDRNWTVRVAPMRGSPSRSIALRKDVSY